MGCLSLNWSVDTPLESVLELSAFHLVLCLVHSHIYIYFFFSLFLQQQGLTEA